MALAMDKPPVLLILGLGHSGTTMMDLALGSADGVVGVGEGLRLLDDAIKRKVDSSLATRAASAWRMLRDERLDEITCTCGQPANICPVWSRAAEFIRPSSFADRAELLLDAAAATQEGVRYIVDATPGAARYLPHLTGRKVYVLHLVRDMRSWTRSQIRRNGSNPISTYAKWRRANQRMVEAFADFGDRYFRIGYEEFALEPRASLEMICNWLGLDFDDRMIRPSENTKSHAISGNSLLRRKGAASEIRYDGAWLAEPSNGFVNALAYAVLGKKNRAWVYGNGLIGARR